MQIDIRGDLSFRFELNAGDKSFPDNDVDPSSIN